MLENGHSNLQTNLWVHITSNIFKISNSKITGSHQPPDLPTLKAYPPPGVGGRFGIFSLKWRERMNLKVPGTTLPLGCAIFSTRARTVRGLVQPPPPLRRTRVKVKEGKHFENFDFFSKNDKKKSKFKNLTFDPYNWGKFCKYGYSRGQGLPSDQVSTLNSYPYLRALS